MQPNKNNTDRDQSIYSLLTYLLAPPGALIGAVTLVVEFIILWQSNFEVVSAVVVGATFLVLATSLGIIGYCKRDSVIPTSGSGVRRKTYCYGDTWARNARLTLYSSVTVVLVVVPVIIYRSEPNSLKFTVLVANFDGPESKNYRVTETIYQGLDLQIRESEGVEVELVNQSFLTSYDAVKVAQDMKADVIIWGWYGVSDDAAIVSIHVELLSPDANQNVLLCPAAKGQIQKYQSYELTSYSLQQWLSEHVSLVSSFIVGYSKYAQADYAGAIQYFDSSLQPPASDNFLFPSTVAYIYRARSNYFVGKFKESIADYNQVIGLLPVKIPDLYYERAVVYTNAMDYEMAFSDYSEVINIDDRFPCAHNDRANMILLSENNNDANRLAFALSDYELELDRNPYDGASILGIGEVLYLAQEYELSIDYFTKFIELSSSDLYDSYGYLRRSMAYSELGQTLSATNDFNEARRILGDVEAYSALGLDYEHVGNSAKALEMYDSALNIDPSNVDTLYMRASLLINLGSYTEAINNLDRIAQIAPDISGSHIFYKYCLAFDGMYRSNADPANKEFALKNCREAIEIDNIPKYVDEAEEILSSYTVPTR